mmetsp:Transcript_32092/g.84521  ORF Transcript_32092/g.84521 Transcript_32092/m.84521 type:complete len:322 (+) Transcript_32092:87-1052(+)
MIMSQMHRNSRASSFHNAAFHGAPIKRKSKFQMAADKAVELSKRFSVNTADSQFWGPKCPYRKAFTVVLYYVVGCGVFCSVEQWSILKSCYFITVTVTTVGYGDVAPETAGGKVFGIFYILFGLAFIVNIVTGIAADIIEEAHRQAAKTTMSGVTEDNEEEEENLHKKHIRSVVVSLSMIFVCMITGAAYFWLSGEFHALDAVWWSMCTMTTVGYGDLSLHRKPASIWFSIFFIIVSVFMVASAIGNVGAVFDDIAREKKEADLLERLDFDMLKQMDRDGDGVCENEYVCAMVEILELVDSKTLDKFRAQFKAHDKDGSGR